MRVIMRVTISGARNGQPWPGKGETANLPAAEAAALVAAGIAEYVGGSQMESATATPSGEQAVAVPRRSPGRPKKT